MIKRLKEGMKGHCLGVREHQVGDTRRGRCDRAEQPREASREGERQVESQAVPLTGG